MGPFQVKSHPLVWDQSECMLGQLAAKRGAFTSIPLALRQQRQDRPSCPDCGLIYTQILMSCDAQRALNNAQTRSRRGCGTQSLLLCVCSFSTVFSINAQQPATRNLCRKVQRKAQFYFHISMPLSVAGHRSVRNRARGKNGENQLQRKYYTSLITDTPYCSCI